MDVDSSTNRISRAQSTAAKAEREAAERVTEAQKRIREATREEEKQIEVVRDQYEKRTEVERARGENYIESVRNRNYENLSEMRRDIEKEQHRVSRTAEKEIKDLQNHYEQAEHEARKRGETELKSTTVKNYNEQLRARAQGESEIDEVKNSYAIQKQQIEFEKQNSTAAFAKSSQETREQLEQKTRTAVEESNDHYQKVYEGAVKQNRDANMDLNWRANQEIETLKRETAMKLDAYSTQKQDPFYRLVNVDGRLTENDEQFVFTAKIPKHEQDRININIRGSELVISGKRRSEEAIEVEPGRTQRTSSYQSFSETFPLGWPVNPKNMTREWDGDTLVVRIPKRATYEAPRTKPTPERATLQRPKFPKNLPTEQTLVAMNDRPNSTIDVPGSENAKTPPSKRKPRSTPA